MGWDYHSIISSMPTTSLQKAYFTDISVDMYRISLYVTMFCSAVQVWDTIRVIYTWLLHDWLWHYFQVLMLTLKKSFPNVIRFLLCASIFYFAFAFCGWLVLGPYHVKVTDTSFRLNFTSSPRLPHELISLMILLSLLLQFTNLATAAECLFSLVNGDDMFVTFSMIGENSYPSIWLFSRVYLYSFISLFIYFVLNIFISVIIGTYESIQVSAAFHLPFVGLVYLLQQVLPGYIHVY